MIGATHLWQWLTLAGMLAGCGKGQPLPVIDGPPEVDASTDGPADGPADSLPDAPAAAYWFKNVRCNSVATDADGNIYMTGGTGTNPAFLIASYTPQGELRWRTEVVTEVYQPRLVVSGGTVYLAGSFHASITFGTFTLTAHGTSYWDVFLVEMSAADGEVIAARSFGTDDHDEATAVGVDAAGNVTLAGYAGTGTMSFGDASLSSTGSSPIGGFVVSFDAAGHHRWSHGYNGTTVSGAYAYAQDLTVTADGNVGVVGRFRHAADFGNGTVTAPSSTYPSGYLVLYGSDGAIRALRVAHAGLDDACVSVAHDLAGRLAINCIRTQPDPVVPGWLVLHGRIEWFGPTGTLLGGKDLVAEDAWLNKIAFDPAGLVVSAFDVGNATLEGQPLPTEDYGPWLVLTLDPSASSLVEAHRIGAGASSLAMFGFTISPANAMIACGSVTSDLGTVDFGHGPEAVGPSGGYLVQVPR